jgi:fatty acid desaturase
MSGLMRQPQGYWPHFAALGSVVAGYAAGVWLLLAESLGLNLLGTFWLAHALVIGAYMIHECAHNTVFAAPRHNAWLGEALCFLVGASYGDYAGIRHKHMRHHTDRADVVAFDFRQRLLQHAVLLKAVQWLEWAWIPAVDLLMHALVLVLPFVRAERRHARGRVVGLLLVRGSLFAALALVSVKALLWYAVSYLLFLHVLRFMDVHQHTYALFENLEEARAPLPPERDRAYEARNTFSNLVSQRHPWLNLWTLNFGYHNAHHVHPTTPWYALPALHRQLFGDAAAQVLPVAALLKAYARYRVARVLNADPVDAPIPPPERFVGVVGVSFLTAH